MLPAFLESVRGAWHELVAVDTGSRDATAAILAAAGARVLHRAWTGDFAAARNHGLAAATADWILVLDPDERALAPLVRALRETAADARCGAATLRVSNPLPNGARREARLLRMFRRDPAVRFRHAIHEDAGEAVTAHLARTGRSRADLDPPLLHLGYVRDRAAARGKKERDVGILRASLAREPDDLYAWLKLLEQARFWGDEALLAEGAREAALGLEDAPLDREALLLAAVLARACGGSEGLAAWAEGRRAVSGTGSIARRVSDRRVTIRAMEAARTPGGTAADAVEAWASIFAAPPIDLEPPSAAAVDAVFRGSEPEADAYERALASAARAQGALEVKIAEGLAALRHGDRLARLGCHLDDYAREVLDVGKRAAETLAAMGAGLRTRPLLREALRSGRVRLRAAQTVLPIAVGEAEAEWVQRAAICTVRELEVAVRRARSGEQQPDDDWLRFGVRLEDDERLVVDAALELAGEVMPGASRMERLEAVAQEVLGSLPGDPDTPRALGPAFRPFDERERARRAVLEGETERWAILAAAPDWAAPDVPFDDATTAVQIDRRLRSLARLREGWDEIVGHCAAMVKRSRMHLSLGFASFRHYAEERLGLDGKTVEQRAKLEERIWRSPALQEARRQGVSYERLRLLARFSESEVGSWIPRAKALTVVALRREVEGEAERKMRASRRIGAAMPRRIAAALAAALDAVRAVAGAALSPGRCLAFMAAHFLETWGPLVKPKRTRSRQVRERDGGFCQAPGCSRPGTHAHHIAFRSHGGGDEPENQIAVCAFHHLRCIHEGYLCVFGRAPDELTWFLGGQIWRGPGME
ncbi:MAG TPA: glycosyltransferase [Anaeromyxobacteraceae bacterium]|nr:glycosyltransferase [Anaeromyxobacteraceae bacterium]